MTPEMKSPLMRCVRFDFRRTFAREILLSRGWARSLDQILKERRRRIDRRNPDLACCGRVLGSYPCDEKFFGLVSACEGNGAARSEFTADSSQKCTLSAEVYDSYLLPPSITINIIRSESDGNICGETPVTALNLEPAGEVAEFAREQVQSLRRFL